MAGPQQAVLKTALAVLLGVLIALAPVVGVGIALANGEPHEEDEADGLEVVCFSNPRFPVAGKEAEIVVKVSRDGEPVEGLMVMVRWTRAEVEAGHGHGAAGSTQEPAGTDPAMETMAVERTHGVYVTKGVFEEPGKYHVTADIDGHEAEFMFAVRSRPVSWPLVMGLTAFSLLLAGAVAMIKTVRKEW